MAGYCTLTGAVYLTMAPLAWRVLRTVTLGVKSPQKKDRIPNYEAWKHVEQLTLQEASHLWCDVDPALQDTLDSSAWMRALFFAWKKGELNVTYRDGGSVPPTTTRDALKDFAKKHGYNPRFLRDA